MALDWTRLGAWLYENDTPDYTKTQAHNIGTVYVDPRSGNAAAVAADIRAHGLTAGIYYAPNWYPGYTTSDEHAKQVSDFVQHSGIIIVGEPVMLDLEGVSPDWTTAFLTKLRSYLPKRPLAYTNAPFQNQTVVPVPTLAEYGCHWYVQLYYGDMSPADAAAALLEVARIYDPALVHPFYDGARLPSDARDGCVFTLERLP